MSLIIVPTPTGDRQSHGHVHGQGQQDVAPTFSSKEFQLIRQDTKKQKITPTSTSKSPMSKSLQMDDIVPGLNKLMPIILVPILVSTRLVPF